MQHIIEQKMCGESVLALLSDLYVPTGYQSRCLVWKCSVLYAVMYFVRFAKKVPSDVDPFCSCDCFTFAIFNASIIHKKQPTVVFKFALSSNVLSFNS